jgi:biotin operon repressor
VGPRSRAAPLPFLPANYGRRVRSFPCTPPLFEENSSHSPCQGAPLKKGSLCHAYWICCECLRRKGDGRSHRRSVTIRARAEKNGSGRFLSPLQTPMTSLSLGDRPAWTMGVSAMLYQRSMDIERRLEAVLRLIRSGQYSTPLLAAQLGISVPTVSRDVTALRERGHDIRSERRDEGWRYVLVQASKKAPASIRVEMSEARY